MRYPNRILICAVLLACTTDATVDATDTHTAPFELPELRAEEGWVYVGRGLDGTLIRATCSPESLAVSWYSDCPGELQMGAGCNDVVGLPGIETTTFGWVMEWYPDWSGTAGTSFGGFEPGQKWRTVLDIDRGWTSDVTLSDGTAQGFSAYPRGDGTFDVMRFRVPVPDEPSVTCDTGHGH